MPCREGVSAPFALGALAARYELLGVLGQGGMAVVYHARERDALAGPDAPPGREVAIKVVSSRHAGDADTLRRFAREARTVAGLDHPNVVRTLAIEEVGGEAVAIVSAYVPGQTLRAYLRAAGGPLPFDDAASVLRDLAAALAYAHARRIVHRDVKPENVFLERDAARGAGPGRALLADFGIARPLDADGGVTLHGAALGTPAYMPPEQIVGDLVDERTDVYALALVGWEMLAGRRPWEGESLAAVLHKQRYDTLPDVAALRPEIPAYLLDAVRGGLAKDPAGRWRDGAEFLSRLTPRALPLPALAGPAAAEVETVSGETVRVATPVGAPAVAAPHGAPDPAARPANAPLPAWGRRGATPEAAPAALPAARPGRARRRRTGVLLAAALVGTAALAGGLAARNRNAEHARAADAQATGVSDRELAELLRAANAAAASVGRVAPAESVPGGAAAGEVDPAEPAARNASGARTRPATRATPVAPGAARAPRAAPLVAAPRAAAPPAAAAEAAALAPVRAAARTVATDARCQSLDDGDQRACLLAAVARQDQGLNASYQARINRLRAEAGGDAEPAAVRALRAEQRAWVDARDRQCRAAAPGSDGRWGAARAPCFAALSARRAAELDAAGGGADPGPPPD
jgi:uncharacterized protein YecT (DUF1311 family)